MAIIAGELSMYCSPARLLNEPDVIPPVKYLFESDPELSKQENIKMPCKDSLQMKVDEDEFIEIVTFEDKTGDHSDDTLDGGYVTGKSSPDTEFCQEIQDGCMKFNDDHEFCITEKSAPCLDSCKEIQDGCTKFNDDHEFCITEKSAPCLDSCKEIQDGCTKFNDDHEFCITEKSAPCLDSCEERDRPMRDCSPNIIVTTPNSSKDIVETPLPPKVLNGSLKRKSEMKELKIPLKKLRVTTNCVNKKLELEEDEYIFCSKCGKLQIGACSIHCALHWIRESSNVVISEGLTKARATIPKNMELKSSSIPDAGLGIFALERFESDVVFGPYWGEKIDVANVTPNMDQGYMWDIIEHGRVTHVVDARDESHSNWLRFVNCARNEDEQNLVAFQYRGEVYYRAYKVIEPGMELLVWYGDRYACDLDILNKEKPADGPVQCQKCFMICSGPISLASHNKFRCQMSSEHHLWRCMHCDRSFKTPSSLHFHKNIHKGIKPFSCKLCGAVFSYPASRKRHYARQHGQREAFSCKPCDKVFANKNALDAHEHDYHNQGDYKCQVCGQCFTSGISLSNHKRVHERSEAQNVCSICKRRFAYSSTLAKHLREKHPRVKIYRCGKCGKFCSDKRHLALHFAVKHSTEHGNRFFSNDDRQAGPLRGDSSVKQKSAVKCEFCLKAFPTSAFMNRHRATHFRTKNPTLPSAESRDINGHNSKNLKCKMGKFACNVCGKSFQTKPSLNAHKSHHSFKRRTSPLSDSRSGVHLRKCLRTFSCNKCNKSFLTERSLRSHKTHHRRFNNTSPDPAIEENTSLRFEQNGVRGLNTREEHLLTSSLLRKQSNASTLPKSKPNVFTCGVCGKKFLSKNNLHRHKGHHSRGSSILNPKNKSKTYQCSTCLEFFHSRSSLKCHKNRLHEAVDPTSFVCPFCDLTFLSREDLWVHKQDLHSTADPYTCIRCDGRFGTKRTRDRHVCTGKENDKDTSVKQKTTVESKPAPDSRRQETHECKTCLQTFPSTRSLSNHKRSHAGVTSPCVCSICHKGLSSKRSLLRHKQSQHSSTNLFVENKLLSIGEGIKRNSNSEMKTCCNTTKRFRCGEAFSSNRDCIEHRASKQGVEESSQKPTSPPPKNQPSRNNVHVYNEQRWELNGEGNMGLWNCLYCEKQFKSDICLRRHTREQHGRKKWIENEEEAARSFKCSYCDEQFKSLFGKQQHVKEKHHICKYPLLSSGSQSTRPHFGPYGKEYSAKMAFNCDTSPPMNSSKTTMKGAFKCQYCVKNFFNENSRYKHIKIFHSGRFGRKRSRDRHVFPGKESDRETSVKQKTPVESKPALDSGRQETHECKTCLQTFPSTRSLSNHKRSHAGVTSPCVCSICHKGLSSKRSLLRHKQSQHSSTNLFVENKLRSIGDGIKRNSEMKTCCNTTKRFHCGEAFSSNRDCIEHRASKQGVEESSQKPTSPPRKNQPSRNNVHVYNEQRRKLSGEGSVCLWNCLYCEKQFKSDSCLRRHTREQHGRKKWIENEEEAARSFKCSYCDEQFKSLFGKQQHVKEKHHICKYSLLSSGSQSTRPHFGPYSKEYSAKMAFNCDTSPPMNSSKTTMKGAFKCQYCVKGFFNANSRYKHIKIFHSGRFGRKRSRDRHVFPGKESNRETSVKQKTPVESKPALDSGRQETHECKTCLQTFPSTRSLSNHKRSHAGVTSPCVCSICHKGLSSKRSLLRHKQSQHSSTNLFVENTSRSICEGIKRNSNSEVNTCCNTTERFRCGEAFSSTRDCIEHRASKQGVEESSQKPTSPPKKTQPSRNNVHVNSEQSLELIGEGSEGLWNCLYCEKQFESDSGLRRHTREQHGRKKWIEYEEEAARSFKCSYYDEEFKSPSGKQMMSPAEEMGSKSSDQSLELEHAIGHTVESDVPFGCFRPGSTSASQPPTKLKAFQCDYCSKRFHTCSVMYKHYVLVHSKFVNLGEHDFVRPMTDPTKKPSQLPVPIPTSTINPKDSDLVSQGCAGGLGHSPLHVNSVSTTEEDLDSFACRVCAKLFQTKSDWGLTSMTNTVVLNECHVGSVILQDQF